ncbi:hypothetical protein DFJ74DRAFT_764469 [Hyaloraphidium curvatum]|nr:hypothetical protein DFJ74DRAFT_764469 [Hyaloraphidium curvatum]
MKDYAATVPRHWILRALLIAAAVSALPYYWSLRGPGLGPGTDVGAARTAPPAAAPSQTPCAPSPDVCRPWTRRPELRPSNSSWHRCLHARGGPAKTRCYFRNVCVGTDGRLLYYTGGKEMPEWNDPLLYLVSRAEEPYFNRTRLNVSVINEALPDVPFFPSATVYFESFQPENFGHALDDNFFPAWRLLSMFGMGWDRDVLYLAKDSRPDLCTSRFELNRRHCEHLQDFARFFGGRPAYAVRNPPAEWTSGGAPGGGKRFCARHLVAGFSGWSMNHDEDSRHDPFVDMVMCRAGVDPRGPLPREHRVAFFNKTSRRVTVNTAELADAVRRTFGVPVDVLDVASMGFVEQIRAMQNYTLAIAPTGGIGFSTMFLPYGASSLYIGNLEIWLWTSRLRARDHFYLPQDEELLYNRTEYTEKVAQYGADNPKARGVRRNCDNRVDVGRFLGAVRQALDGVDWG